ncbi:uncharacterized protein [Leptinotarsa decemlineata]|uniref:uncharacterized protein n=1 Tax=Leptinotarsa decemlineata TaxID=7539 RepID=UPI003D30990A
MIVVEKSFDDHLKNLEEKGVRYLRHVVSEKGVVVDEQKFKAVKEWPIPKDIHQIWSFLGLSTYYRRYVLGFANITKPLTRLIEGQIQFQWSEESQHSFKKLKKALINAPVSSYLLPDGKFILDTDASIV